MSDSIKLSIIIPVYNLQEYIPRALDSILDMTFTHKYEVIVVNDGSTDNSLKEIERYKKRLSEIRIITITNSGVSVARNTGIHLARGEYITFLDGDDYLEPLFLEEAIRELDAEQYDFVQFNHTIVQDDKSVISIFPGVQEDTVVSSLEEKLRLFFSSEKKIQNSVWGKVFRAEVIEGIDFDAGLKISEDQKFIFDVLLNTKELLLKKSTGYNYVLRQNSTMKTISPEDYDDWVSVLNYCLKKVENSEIRALINGQKMEVLLAKYNRELMSPEDNKTLQDLRQQIKQLSRTKECKAGKKAYIKAFMLSYCSWAYKTLVKAYINN